MSETLEQNEIAALQQARHLLLVGSDARSTLTKLLTVVPAEGQLATRLTLSLKLGVPVAELLEQQLALLREQLRTQRELTRLYSTPKLTAQLILWLPIAGAIFGQLLGLGPLSFLLFSPVGLVVLGFGLLLNFAGWRWTRRLLLATPRAPDLAPSLEYLLLSDCLSAGLTPRVGIDHLRRVGVLPSEDLLGIVAAQRKQGYPLLPLLREQANRQIEIAVDRVRDGLEALPTRLLIPIGVALLPAFLLLNVLPAAATALLAY